MTGPPIPVEVVGEDGVRLRGLEWPTPGPPVIAVHDYGADLDQWGPLTRALAEAGYRVVSLELSGHGLSDGDPDQGSISRDIATMVAQTAGIWGPVGLITLGESARGAVGVGGPDGAPVHILVSPPTMSREILEGAVKAMRIIVAGGGDTEGHAAAKSVYDHLPGQRLLMTVSGASERGAELTTLRPSILEDIAQFFRQYLAPINMAWIARREAEAAETS